MSGRRGWRTSVARAVDRPDEWRDHPLPVHDARRVPDGSVLEYDVCVVGSGAAACTAVLSLVGHGLRVVVLESGGEVRDDLTTQFNTIDGSRDLYSDESRGRWLGGTTNLWTGGITTLDPIDLRERAWVPDSGWPIDEETLRACYRRAAELYGYHDPAFFDAPDAGAGHAETDGAGDGFRFDSEDLRTLVFHKDRQPRRFAEDLRSRLGAADGVHLFTLANVTSVELDESGDRVAGVEVETLLGGRFTVRSRAVLLGCGALENARLLLASRSRRAAGLGNEHDLVGRYLQDHPKGFTAELALSGAGRRLPARPYWPTRANSSTGATRWGIGLTEAAQERLATLNTYVRLEPVVVGETPPGVRSLRAAARGRVRKVDLDALGGVLSERETLRQMARFRLRNEGPIDAILVRTFIEQEPVYDNRIRLSDRLDPLGHPLSAVDCALSDLDLHSVRAVHEALDHDLRRRGLGELRAVLDDDGVRAAVGDASHHAGTTRMGVDPTTSVTDPHGEVRGVPGLFALGSSLFPTSGYANPVFTILAMTIRTADRVVEQLAARPIVVEEPEPRFPTDAGLVEAKRWLGARRRTRRLRPTVSRAAAVVWPAPGQVELLPVEVAAPRDRQISVLVDASAISAGTERARWLGQPGAAIRYPHHPGYSLAGTVHAVGPGVYDLAPGDRVAVWGAPHQSLVTVGRAQALALADDADAAAASLVTLGAIAAFGVARAGDVGGRSIAVTGAGAIGLLAQRLALAGGADRSTVIAASNAKDAVARRGGDVTLGRPDQIDGVEADVVIEATGTPDGLENALRAAGVGATVVLLGTTRAESASLALDLVVARRLRLVGAHAGLLDAAGGTDGLDRRSAARHFLDSVSNGSVRVDDLVTSRVDPLDIRQAYERLAVDRRGVVPVIEWWRMAPDLRVHDGPLPMPNLVRRGLASLPRVAVEEDRWAAPVVEHPPAPRREVEYGADEQDRAAQLAELLSTVGPLETIDVTGPIAPVEIDVQTLVHRRGTTLAGVSGGDEHGSAS